MSESVSLWVREGKGIREMRLLYLLMLSSLLAGCASMADRHAAAEAAFEKGDYATAFPQLQKLAGQGDVDAERYLGYMYWYGVATHVDYAESIKWYTAAANAGDVGAEADLGDIYASGVGVPQDWQKAGYWYQQAALQGVPRAEAYLGVAYMLGRSVPQDYETAQAWLTKAVADGDDGTAEAGLGNLYLMGWGVPKDYDAGKAWFDKAAAKQNRAALLYIGTLYRYGQLGYPKDEAQSAHYYEMAADVPVKSMGELMAVMKSIIDLHKTYPAEALSDHETGQATIEFDCPDKAPLNIKVTHSSGHPALDKAAMSAVQQSLFPVRPASMAGVVHFVVAVNFENDMPAATPAPAAATAAAIH